MVVVLNNSIDTTEINEPIEIYFCNALFDKIDNFKYNSNNDIVLFINYMDKEHLKRIHCAQNQILSFTVIRTIFYI